MKIYSFIRKELELVPVEVELGLSPGLPQLQCLGMPDPHIRESTHRVRSALKQQGFDFPKGRQVLVNLRPSYGKKSSRGLDFAIAAALLWETGQLPRPKGDQDLYLYGELSLGGEVYEPEDLQECSEFFSEALWTGTSQSPAALSFERKVFRSLSELAGAGQRIEPAVELDPQRPIAPLALKVSPEQARLLSIIAIGEHPTLLLGPSGTGKSTLGLALSSLLAAPDLIEFRKLRRTARKYGEEMSWRPLVKPHHTTTAKAMVGGGQVPGAGEVTRAHGGILMLDELFEFQPRVLEALREPIEDGKIRVARGGQVKTFAARSLIIGTANLCPCGDWAPGRSTQCSYSLRRCQSYIERMSGPLLDRFQVMSFSHTWRSKSAQISLEELLEELEAVRQWRGKTWPLTGRPTSQLAAEECLVGLTGFARENLLPQFSSRRRELAAYRVARSIADLEKSEYLAIRHIEEALRWAVTPWQQLKTWM